MPAQKRRRVLFLYTRLPDYFYQCIMHFVNSFGDEVVVIRYREDGNAKYIFPENEGVRLMYKDEVDVEDVAQQFSPSAIVVSGWSDSDYRQVVKLYVKKIPVIVGIDNPWVSKTRQWILCIMSPLYVHSCFNMAWVPGKRQREYALKLGFTEKRTLDFLYAANTQLFYRESEAALNLKRSSYPHTLVYLGRIVEYKQPHVLARIFHEVVEELNSDWQLIIAGEGPLKGEIQRNKYKQVHFGGFVSPADIPAFYAKAGAFCLPGKEENWGVAVHEAAAAGLPLILSDTVQAATAFLKTGENGFAFRSRNEQSLRKTLMSLMQLEDAELLRMGQKSIELSKLISQEKWSESLDQGIQSFCL